MALPDALVIQRLLEHLYGVALQCEVGINPDGSYVALRPTDLEPTSGFTIRLKFGWRSISMSFEPQAYSRPLMIEMGKAANERRKVFSSIASTLTFDGAQLTMRLDGQQLNACDPASWPATWSTIEIAATRSPIIFNLENSNDALEVVTNWGGRFWAMVLSLLPTEESLDFIDPGAQGLPEGSLSRVEVNRYERNPFNRTACIAAKGTICVVCGFDFRDLYGEIGAGFIHVHHVTMISEVGEDYILDPIKDLEPVCPNCHAMLHTVTPPLTIAELRRIVCVRRDAVY